MRQRGFTLIELLVVISIIGLLASVVLASLTSARAKARDAKRAGDMRAFRTALELYYGSANHYPYSCNDLGFAGFDGYSGNQVCSVLNGASGTYGIGTLSTVMSPYINNIHDPKTTSGDSGYLYLNLSGPNDYFILLYNTIENMNNFPSSAWQVGRCGTVTNGQCSGTNTLFLGAGTYAANGC